MRAHWLALVLVAAVGCSSPATRAVSGQLRVDTSAMNHPVVIAQSSDHRVFVAGVSAAGRFTLQLPPNAAYRMTLSSTMRTGVYSAAARINWPSNTLRCGEAGESASRRGQHSNRLFHVLLGVSASDLVLRRKGRGLSGIGLIP